MSSDRRYDICASVISDLEFDARVWKEARSLAADGRTVALVGTVFDIDRPRRRIDKSGVEVFEVPLGNRAGSRSRSRRVRALLRVWLEIVRTPARAYHAHDIHVVIPAWIASRLRRARLVYDAHELWSDSFEKGLKSRLAALASSRIERLAMRASDAVITTNRSRAKALGDRYGRDDITILANVPVLQDDVAPSDPGYPPATRVILYLGRISASGRAFRETVQALPMLDDDIALAVVGFGWDSERAQIREWAQQAGVANRVALLPALPFDELAPAAAAAAVGLVPIYGAPLSNALGDTNKLHEYLMAGLPVVASDLPEIRRVVTSGDPPVGELFDAHSPESIAAAVRAVLADPRYDERRAQARLLATEHFNWQTEELKLRSVYGRLLGSAPPSPAGVALERA